MPTKVNLIGPQGQTYADPKPSPDEDAFQVNNTSAAYYNSPYYTKHKNQVQPIPPQRTGALPYLDLTDFIPQDMAAAINTAGKITFHMVGDTGAAKTGPHQSAAVAIGEEAGVADAMTADVQNGGGNGPAFFFHLGDVVYNFGEAQYYYDQFYEPYRAYPAPIFAIPGNHDSFVVPGTADDRRPLVTFQRNFCSELPVITPEAGSLHRTAMTQPGVYYCLDAPFVRIIGLFSNALEDPGVISNRSQKWSNVNDVQLEQSLLPSRPSSSCAPPSRPICRSNNRPSLSCGSTSRPPMR